MLRSSHKNSKVVLIQSIKTNNELLSFRKLNQRTKIIILNIDVVFVEENNKKKIPQYVIDLKIVNNEN